MSISRAKGLKLCCRYRIHSSVESEIVVLARYNFAGPSTAVFWIVAVSVLHFCQGIHTSANSRVFLQCRSWKLSHTSCKHGVYAHSSSFCGFWCKAIICYAAVWIWAEFRVFFDTDQVGVATAYAVNLK